jgi:hypothetical protein
MSSNGGYQLVRFPRQSMYKNLGGKDYGPTISKREQNDSFTRLLFGEVRHRADY